MNDKDSESTLENVKQSVGTDSRSAKRNSGLFSFFKWLKSSGSSVSRESLNSDKGNDHSVVGSCESLTSLSSSGTVASFSFIEPSAYSKTIVEKNIKLQPETDTYKDRLKQRDKRREKDKNTTLRKKYNLFFNTSSSRKEEENTKSLPLMTKPTNKKEELLEENFHRRTNSDSSKFKRAGAYLHVKGKRKAPQPPSVETVAAAAAANENSCNNENNSSTLKRRSKRLAPSPPPKDTVLEDEVNSSENQSTPETERSNANQKTEQVSNDILKLDNGFLRPLIESEQNIYAECSPFSITKANDGASKLWYKRQHDSNSTSAKRDVVKNSDHFEKLPRGTFNRTSNSADMSKKPKDDKRKSGVSFLTNISQLDREAAEILQKERQDSGQLAEIPEFMKLKEKNTDSWISPKRSARDLIAKFNAITNVTKVTVNTALFGTNGKEAIKRDFFGKSSPKVIRKHQEALLESHKKRIELIDKKLNSEKKIAPLLKSESAVSVVQKPETPKTERKNWNCPKCRVQNEYWRIICHLCSAIKPYFDDLTRTPSPIKAKEEPVQNQYERILERSRTQVGFAGFKSASQSKPESADGKFDKKDEREKLKKMLIEMKNSLPKKTVTTTSLSSNKKENLNIVTEKPEMESKHIQLAEISDDSSEDASDSDNENLANEAPTLAYKNDIVKSEEIEAKVPEENDEKCEAKSVIVETKTTIYENIKVKNVESSRVDSSSQTTSVLSSISKLESPQPSEAKVKVSAMIKKKNSFEPMKIEDFEDIYSDQNGKSTARIYANLARNDELSLFFNGPKNLAEMKNTLSKMKLKNRNKGTIEINRLLRRLEVAIAKGDMTQAADFAKELAQLKVNCSVVRQKSISSEDENEKEHFSVDMYVEDKVSHRGPFPLQLKHDLTVGQLKKQIEKEFEIPAQVQRWILGKELATDDEATLLKIGLTNGCSIFLYLVAPDSKTSTPISNHRSDTTDVASTSSAPFPLDRIEQAAKERKLYPEINLPTDSNAPKIIDAVTKPAEKTDDFADGKHDFKEVVRQIAPIVLYQPTLAVPEDDEEYDVRTLKPSPSNEWECHLCTLLNPVTSNVCGVCATVRKIPPKKTERKKSIPRPQAAQTGEIVSKSSSGETYAQLMNLDQEDLVHNVQKFECVVCFAQVEPKAGVTLRECLHQFCKECLRHTIEFCEEAEVKCPYRDEQYSCDTALQDREIKALISKKSYDQYLEKSVAQAENRIDKSFHCKTPDCKGWCIYEDNVNEFKCPVCRRINCLTCQAIHMGLNCKQYQQRMIEESEIDENAKQTREMLDEMVRTGEALKCPTCHVVMMKKWGCDWLRCSMCKTEICWVTRGPRWGPDGKGDITGGCKCGVNGIKCHPKCNYCH